MPIHKKKPIFEKSIDIVMTEYPKFAVIGGGSWATAIVKILSNNVDTIHWWVRTEDTAEFIRKFISKYLQ